MMQALSKVNAQASMEEAAQQQAVAMANMAEATTELVKIAKGNDPTVPPVIDYDQLAAAIAPLKGKFTFSETMRDTLSGASSKLANQMQVLADVLPEYGGNSGGYTEAQVTKARNYMQDLVITTAEVLALKRAFDDGKRVISQTNTSKGNNIFKQSSSGTVSLSGNN